MSRPKKVIAINKEAFFKYDILEKIEAGIQLLGAEVKAIRSGRVRLSGGYVQIRNREASVVGMRIDHYAKAPGVEYDPTRTRKLLLHKREIIRLKRLDSQKGVTLIPLRLYFKRNLAKLEVGVARGRRRYDKRARLKARQTQRDLGRT